MIRHFKMELLKRQQQEELLARATEHQAQTASPSAAMPTGADRSAGQHLAASPSNWLQPLQQAPQLVQKMASGAKPSSACKSGGSQRGSRSRRASKPQMEKRRRARINECLDTLKSYVLTDSSNLTHLGIDLAASENQDEETIARTILKSSGLIHRHKGRKNPNKLEKADILELTVDYVRRLHEQRNELLLASDTLMRATTGNGAQLHAQVPAHLSEPLMLDLSPKNRHQLEASDLLARGRHQSSPLTPPPSSASSMQSDDSVAAQHQVTPQMILSRVLDSYKLYDSLPQTSARSQS